MAFGALLDRAENAARLFVLNLFSLYFLQSQVGKILFAGVVSDLLNFYQDFLLDFKIESRFGHDDRTGKDKSGLLRLAFLDQRYVEVGK